ncbi:coagulation factor XIII A chain-like isoform X2 [Paramormyrops kingsleyae]|uniref:Coagulation factor XIII A chain n=2 Tax=Paramormyrops kingsleyae TaxID=1676925 RepID=A0A3B3SFT9_9TELE|nr:coagulation factor XIII A chain-like isoform X2 [Paramormyrops kingsleyae]XP_023655949.1 coagulation factor XIII A chain-like isoform X2 [Paramormyrops kingsleyae]
MPDTQNTEPNLYDEGRRNVPRAYSNAKENDLHEFIPFEMVPRGPAPPRQEFLQVTQVDMLWEKNMADHHTQVFSGPHLIIRRGQEFQVKITFNRAYDPDKDKFELEFRIGSSPNLSEKTIAVVSSFPRKRKLWQSHLLKNTGSTVLMGITPSASCIVGKYSMYVVVITSAGRFRDKDHSQEVYILFNPWAPHDTVFMPDDHEREEYVLNQVGMLYCGDSQNVLSRPWNYGQFEMGILDACVFIMDEAIIPLIYRGDPIKIMRRISAKLNSQDDDGVLVGNWSDDYTFGTAPTSWTGSVEILLSYASSGIPVCFAQCWVFAGVFNTILRCLGIPSRTVTGYKSAHDNNGNLKTNIIVDQSGRLNMDCTTDSIWSYHCWNEVYMARPDLPVGFGGWQVVDSTPQDNTDGFRRCGPAPVYAIKQGMICYPFDAPYMFSEVNSDVIVYQREQDNKLTKLFVDHDFVGEKVLTKQIGQDIWCDITNQYKYPAESSDKQEALRIAESYGCSRDQGDLSKADVKIKATLPDVEIGKDFKLSVELKNLGESLYNIDVSVSGNVIYYTGVLGPQFKFKNFPVKVDPSKTVTEHVAVKAEEYMSKLLDQCSLSFLVMAEIKETGQVVTTLQYMTLQAPKLELKMSGSHKLKEEMTVTMKFTNSLKFDLENITVKMEGPGVFRTKTKTYRLIARGSSISWTESFTPDQEGQKTLIACLNCALLRQVFGHVDFTIKP